MKEFRFILPGLIIIAMGFTLSACAPKTTPHPPTVEVPAQSTATAVESQNQGSGDTSPVDTAVPQATESGGLASDIPIMEGAYQLQVMRNGNSVIYQIDSDTQTVVKFYEDNLPNYGWELAGPPDSAVGSIATMLRENKDKDRLTINMQENTLGGFVKLTISVVRGNTP
jgi:hypothetical protein